jgi:hypothetical protein
MPTSPPLRELDRQLRPVVGPPLEGAGFQPGADRCFRRIRQAELGTLVQFVHFQPGIKSLAGKFTVNLRAWHSVFRPSLDAVAPEEVSGIHAHLEPWIRLGTLVPAAPSLLERMLGRRPEPVDRWWPQSADPAAMAATLQEVAALLVAYAPAWFDSYGTEAACKQAHEDVLARRARFGKRPQ